MRKRQKIINIFDDEMISSIKQVFSISDEDDLDQCWHYFHHHYQESKGLQNFIALFYEFSNQFIMNTEKHFFDLILEKSKDDFLFTVWNKHVSEAFSNFLADKSLDFRFDSKRVSVRIKKAADKVSEDKANDLRNNKILQSIKDESQKTKDIPVFDFLEADDLEELLVLCEDMQDIMEVSKRHGFIDALFIRLRSCFSLFSLSLRSYPQLSKITTAITGFSALINTNQERFAELSVEEIQLFEGFFYSIERWLKALFIEGGVQLGFMDNSLNADLETITSVIAYNKEINPSEENDLDAIFNF